MMTDIPKIETIEITFIGDTTKLIDNIKNVKFDEDAIYIDFEEHGIPGFKVFPKNSIMHIKTTQVLI